MMIAVVLIFFFCGRGIYGVRETRSPLRGGGGDGNKFPIGDQGRGWGYFHHPGSGTRSVIPGPAPPRPVAIPNLEERKGGQGKEQERPGELTGERRKQECKKWGRQQPRHLLPLQLSSRISALTKPGWRSHEVSFLCLLEKISDDCVIKINETGTKLKYEPGIVNGGKHLVHDSGVSRSIGYFLEPLIVLGLFGKKPLSIRLKGITNDSKDPSVDTFRSTTLPILKHFGCSGALPHGGGDVFLSVPTVRTVTWIDEGMVKRLGELLFQQECLLSLRIPLYMQLEEFLIACFRMSTYLLIIKLELKLEIAETTIGCFISADTAVSYARGDEEGEIEDEEKKELMPPVDVGEQIASILLGKIERGVVDSTHQGLLFILCALCPQDVSKVRVGKLSPYGIETPRNIRDFLGVKFVIKPDPSTGTVILKCVGCGLTNLSRKAS
ncbi:hypothetical protein HYC85_013964 [Camellia sinensis]|uniref:RNA 3'-terminal phosphate cyclase domain-containing protein n=1 Tax=Camellia sinensis TaxID=4442 RepID=A0A7J7H622_CAMSI|nr:hypothetical protein HYC85_013964 [Camellia sinensis]